jgi:hypothetical protein
MLTQTPSQLLSFIFIESELTKNCDKYEVGSVDKFVLFICARGECVAFMRLRRGSKVLNQSFSSAAIAQKSRTQELLC